MGDDEWLPHTTRRDLGFARYEWQHDGVVEFREAGWLLRVPWTAVSRAAPTPKPSRKRKSRYDSAIHEEHDD